MQGPLAALLLAVALAWWGPLVAGEAPAGGMVLDHARFLASTAATPPDPRLPGWRAVELPDVWHLEHADEPFPAWYLFTFHIGPGFAAPGELWAIHLPALNTNVELWLNGHKIGDGGRMTPGRVASNWHRPLFFTLSHHQLREGENLLHIRFMPKASRFGYLWPVEVGPEERLRPRYERKRLIKETLVGISALLLLAFGLFLLLIWWMRRSESLYGWFAAGCLVWSLFVFDMYVRHPPFPERVWDTLVFASVGWMVIFMTFFFHRFYAMKKPRLERAVAAVGLLGTVALYLAGDEHFYFFASFVWDNLLILFSLYLVWVIVCHTSRQPSLEHVLLSIAAAVVLLFGGHDNLVQMGVLDFDHTHLLPYGAPFLVGVLIWMLARRFGRALRQSEELNRELDARVSEKVAELESSYHRLRHAESEKVLAQERERIMRDMHDGTGGYLVSALSLIRREPIDKELLGATLQQALDDLRLMIDSLDSIDEDLLVVLGMFRSRIEPRLKYSGIEIRWQVRDLPPVEGIGPESVLQLMRILQEIVTNTLKHAGASTITFSTGIEGAWIYIEVRDDGRGFPKVPEEGRGIANMRHRAAAIGARLEMGNDPKGGARVRILLPRNTPLPG